MKVLKSLTKAEWGVLVLLLLVAILNFFPTVMVTVIPSGMMGLEYRVPYETQQSSEGMLYLIVPAGLLLCFSDKIVRILGTIFGGLAFLLQLFWACLLNSIEKILVICDAPSHDYALSALGWICVSVEAVAFLLQIVCFIRRFKRTPQNNDSEEMIV